MLWPATLPTFSTMAASSEREARTPSASSRTINIAQTFSRRFSHAISAIPASRSYRIQPPVLGGRRRLLRRFPLSDGRTAFLIADVSGKGLGAAILTTHAQARFPE